MQSMAGRMEDIVSSEIKRNRRITSERLAKLAGVSRQAAHKRLAALVRRKKLVRVGSTRGAYYERYSPGKVKGAGSDLKPMSLRLRNRGLEEHRVLERIEAKSPVFRKMRDNARSIFGYAFTEMLNNAIEHSKSKWINVKVYSRQPELVFEVIDQGVGVYNNLMRKYKVRTDLEAVQELLKGKRTTAPRKHSGEGIFFTEKISDRFELESGKTRLVIDNAAGDVAVKEVPLRNGTRVLFRINMRSKKSLTALFGEYTDEEYRFSKTKVLVNLYEHGVDYVSRSRARRVLYGLDKFSAIILDFKKIKGIGQGFADEIFRVYAHEHPKTRIIPRNASNTVMFMINRAKS